MTSVSLSYQIFVTVYYSSVFSDYTFVFICIVMFGLFIWFNVDLDDSLMVGVALKSYNNF